MKQQQRTFVKKNMQPEMPFDCTSHQSITEPDINFLQDFQFITKQFVFRANAWGCRLLQAVGGQHGSGQRR